MATYDYIVNNPEACKADMPDLLENLRRADHSGQFLASLIEGAIEKDREHRYIGSLLEAIWGADYAEHVDALRESDDVFRRLYKRVYPQGVI